ncbi:MAG: hypothetical protein ACERKN_05890 [Velocimicrobium sp.]
MKLKYFLRGLGIGILVTASILTISHRNQDRQQVITKDEIIERAEKIGMVMPEETILQASGEAIDSSKLMSPSNEPTVEPTVTPTVTPTETKHPVNTPIPSAEPTSTPIATIEPTKKPATSTKKEKPTVITVKIEKGMWSEAVSRAMEKAGLIEDAKDFNAYLADNGYASYISVGTYQIEQGATYQEIAKKITGR